MTVDPVERAEQQGREAFAHDLPLGKNPYNMAQGSPTRPLCIAWRRGHRAAQAESEIAEQESAGHFRDAR